MQANAKRILWEIAVRMAMTAAGCRAGKMAIAHRANVFLLNVIQAMNSGKANAKH